MLKSFFFQDIAIVFKFLCQRSIESLSPKNLSSQRHQEFEGL